MTLYECVVGASMFLSSALITVLALLRPPRPDRRALCFKTSIDAECAPACLRTCFVKGAQRRDAIACAEDRSLTHSRAHRTR